MGRRIEYIEGALVVRAGAIERWPEDSVQVHESVEDLDDDELMVVQPLADGWTAKLRLDEYNPQTDADRFVDERRVIE